MGFNMVQTNGMNSRRPTLTGIIFHQQRSIFPMAADQLQMEAEIALVGDVDWNL